MTTFSDFQDKVYRAIYETAETGPTDLLISDGLAAAQESILERVGKHATHDWTGDSSTVAFELPDDCYEIQGIREVSETGKLIPSAVLSPGNYFGDYPEEQNFLDYPHGYITFGKTPDTGDILRLYYTAYWDTPTMTDDVPDETFILEVPKRVERAVLFYACAYCLLPEAVSASGLRQFGTKVDSGNPEHNPVEKTVEFFLKLYDMEIAKQPLDTGGTTIG